MSGDDEREETYYGRDGKIRVLSEQCSTCIGRPGNLMQLRAGRVRQMVQDSVRGGGGIICHQTLRYGDHPESGGAMCRWFYDCYGHLSNGVRIMMRLGGITEVELPQDEEEGEEEAG